MKKALGLDLGSKTLGIAMSDSLRMIAHGVETFRFTDNHYSKALARVLELVEKEPIDTIVLGLPKHMNGDVGIRGNISIKFKEELEENLTQDIKVILSDERMTTKIAEQSLIFQDVSRKKRKQVVDKMAAVVILQNYLDFNK